jgi:5-methylcytosine-specific restriction enzyme A
MAQIFAKPFYNSKEWKRCRELYIQSVNGLCERCYSKNKIKPGYIVHHKTLLTLANIDDPSVTLNHSNLYYVCKDCHEEEHHGENEVIRQGLTFTSTGDIAPI